MKRIKVVVINQLKQVEMETNEFQKEQLQLLLINRIQGFLYEVGILIQKKTEEYNIAVSNPNVVQGTQSCKYKINKYNQTKQFLNSALLQLI